VEKRILFVVRDRAMREHLAQTFCGRGFRVITASDGVGGLFQFGLRQPHLVVLDVNGWETLQRIRTLSDIPIIALVEDTPEAKVECLDRGADYFLVKPPSMGELEARARVLLRKESAMHSGAGALEERAQDLTDLSIPLGI
jgi:two-component system KDP operon response regulator KdpE